MKIRTKSLKNLKARQRGFTLVELLVAISASIIIGSALVGSLFQVSLATSRGQSRLAASSDVRIAFQWMAKDVGMATSTSLVDGAQAVTSMTLGWTDYYNGAGTNHSVSYALVGTDLQRTYDSTTQTVARNVTSVTFSLSGKLITVTMTSSDGNWADIQDQTTQYLYLQSM